MPAARKCWMIFHPGTGYSTSWCCSDVEDYPSFALALRAFDRLPDPYYPCAYPDAYQDRETGEHEGAEGWLFFYDPREGQTFGDPDDPDVIDVYPDRIIRYGPRCGVRWEHA